MITGEQIRAAREAKGWERSHLARHAKVHHASVRWAEIGADINPKARKAILKALGLTESIDSNGTVRKVKEVIFPPTTNIDELREKVKEHFEDDEPPLVSGGEIDGNTTTGGVPIGETDVYFPGTLIMVARDESLTIGQMLNLLRVKSVLNDNGGNCNPVTVEEWRSFCRAMKGCL